MKLFGSLFRNVIDLRHEEAREYRFPDGSKTVVEYPATLQVITGEHHITDTAGVGVIFLRGWTRCDVYPLPGYLPFGGMVEAATA